MLLTTVHENMKEFGINLIKYMLDLHVKNNKALMKEISECLQSR